MRFHGDVYIETWNSNEFDALIEGIRNALEPHGCTKPQTIKWSEIEQLMTVTTKLKFRRKPPDISDGLSVLLDSWKFDKFLHGRVKDAFDLQPHTFISFEEFRKSMDDLFRKLAERIEIESKSCARFIHLLASNGKSQVWMMFSFLEYCRDKVPHVFKILKSKLRIYKSNITEGKCVLYKRDSCFLWIDDVAYSGSQLGMDLESVSAISRAKHVAGVVYASPTSIRRFEGIGKKHNSNIKVLKSGTIQSLSAKNVKWLLSNNINFFNRKGEIVTTLWGVLGARAPCRTFFEHKVADTVSLPIYMSSKLRDASPAILVDMKVVSYESNGLSRRLPVFRAEGKNNIVAKGWLYGDFCDYRETNDNQGGERQCFKPKYKTEMLKLK